MLLWDAEKRLAELGLRAAITKIHDKCAGEETEGEEGGAQDAAGARRQQLSDVRKWVHRIWSHRLGFWFLGPSRRPNLRTRIHSMSHRAKCCVALINCARALALELYLVTTSSSPKL